MGQMSIISLIMNASLIVKFVMALLLIFSIVSWGIIFSKLIQLSRSKKNIYSFFITFSETKSISELYKEVKTQKSTSDATTLFSNSLSEYNRLNNMGISDREVIVENIERTLGASIDNEVDYYQSGLSTLATFGSVSPYIGLFGTVWGIMNAFVGLGNTTQATLASVAPGIAEALVATAMGLFVAIPAYIAYNKYTKDVNHLDSQLNIFADELLNLISRKAASKAKDQ